MWGFYKENSGMELKKAGKLNVNNLNWTWHEKKLKQLFATSKASFGRNSSRTFSVCRMINYTSDNNLRTIGASSSNMTFFINF